MSSKANSVRSVIYALSANFAIAVAKAVAAIFTHSGAMLAEAIHSTADTGNQILLLWGMKSAKKPPNEDFPLGFGKEIYFWSFIVALLLFSMGGLFSIYEGWHKLHNPSALSYPWVALGVLGFSIVAEGLSFLGCVREINKVRGKDSLWRWFRESRQSELIVVFGEDLAALIGLVLASSAIVLTMITGNPLYDAIGTISIGILLFIIALLVGIEVKALLIGQGIEKKQKEKMQQFLNQQPELDKLYNIITLQMGTDVMVAIKARMKATGSEIKLIENINTIEKKLREEFPQITWSFFEPDIKD
ncbi:MAG TPA: cation diffusion facilitator family transporter [Aeromonadales bacterium]|nr:cation diffusion facilitator family transporter [Aeromonadales bacterium]